MRFGWLLVFGAIAVLAFVAASSGTAEAHSETPTSTQSKVDQETVRSFNEEIRGTTGPAPSRPFNPRRLETLTRQRAEKMAALADSDPFAAVALALSQEERDRLPTGARRHVEERINLSGELRVQHIDLDDGHSEYQVHISRGDLNTPVRLGTRLNGVRPGDQVRATALSIPGANAAVASGVVADSQSSAASIGQQWTAVILVSASDAGSHPYALNTLDVVGKAHVANLVYPTSNAGSARNYYSEDSYGLTTILGSAGAEGSASDVYGPYTLNYSGCSISNVYANALTAADADINYNNYHRVILVWNKSSCGTGGVAYIRPIGVGFYDGASQRLGVAMSFNTGFGQTPVQGTRIGNVTLHEYGHSLGVWHANALECGSSSVNSGSCSSTEYGDRADVMGTGNFGHFNGAHKDIMGWFAGSRRQEVTTTTSLTLNRYEDGVDNLKSVRIPRTRNSSNQVTGYYYLEYRKPFSPWDGYLSSGNTSQYDDGVLLHASGRYPFCTSFCGPDFTGDGGGGDTHLIDTKPNSTGNDFTDAPIFLNETYTDAGAGVAITVTALTSTTATLNITISGASRSIQTIVFPAGSGSVTGGGVFSNGSSVTLTAVPNNGYAFAGWRENQQSIGSTNPLVFTANSDRVLEAVFQLSPCSPRPQVTVSNGPAPGGMGAYVNSPANILAIRFISTDNTKVDINGQTDLTGSWTVNYPPNTPTIAFVYRRQVQSGPGTVRFEITDTCGTWLSFVGGGDSAW